MSAINGPVIVLIVAIIGFTAYAIHAYLTEGQKPMYMTEELYATYSQRAAKHAAEYAQSTPGREAPLSGELSGEPTPQDVYRAIGINDDMQEALYESLEGAEALRELTDEWESAYHEADPCLCPRWTGPFDFDGPADYASAVENSGCPVHPDN